MPVQTVERKLAAILAADIAGYSRVIARDEGLAEAGSIYVSAPARDHIGNKLPLTFDDLGDQQVKNIPQAIRVYRVQAETLAAKPIAALPLPDKPSIAVLPFANMSGDLEQ